ncbi:homocysteine S-methyltransferase family protein [bacterium]|nr:homocysteine S-methyltransferase family protein [candidate division CSSED10-310 bacterium]
MSRFLETLSQRILLFDGAMGTELITRGMTRGDCSERWVLEEPDQVLAIHADYSAAGADVLITDTFCATRHHLSKHGLDSSLEAVNTRAVRLARQAAGTGKFVAGDVGPTGLMWPPMGTADDTRVAALVTEQVVILVQETPDLILIETQFDLREAVAALRAARKMTSLPVGVTMTFNRTRRGYFTLVGDTVEKCIKTLVDSGADFVGANCSLTPVDMTPLVGLITELADRPVLIQPNAGQPQVQGSTVHYDTSPEQFAEQIRPILDTGVNAIGGCCGTTPRFIQAVRHLLDTRKSPEDNGGNF